MRAQNIGREFLLLVDRSLMLGLHNLIVIDWVIKLILALSSVYVACEVAHLISRRLSLILQWSPWSIEDLIYLSCQYKSSMCLLGQVKLLLWLLARFLKDNLLWILLLHLQMARLTSSKDILEILWLLLIMIITCFEPLNTTIYCNWFPSLGNAGGIYSFLASLDRVEFLNISVVIFRAILLEKGGILWVLRYAAVCDHSRIGSSSRIYIGFFPINCMIN